MKKSVMYYLLSFIIIFLSTPLAYKIIDIVYMNKNLSGEYTTILNGFIKSNMLIGILIFIIGLNNSINEKKNQ